MRRKLGAMHFDAYIWSDGKVEVNGTIYSRYSKIARFVTKAWKGEQAKASPTSSRTTETRMSTDSKEASEGDRFIGNKLGDS